MNFTRRIQVASPKAGSLGLFLISCSLILVQISMAQLDPLDAFYGVENNRRYDPEHNSEGIIPELSSPTSAPATVRWSYDGSQDDDKQATQVKKTVERRSDTDTDDDDEEGDRDEDKSGSNQHGSYTESPSYGESSRAAQDGEDIENFFDTHLGPHEAAESSQHDTDSPPEEMANRDAREDHFEVAASSPLSDIINTFVGGAHRRPLIITTSERSVPSSQQSLAEASSQSDTSARLVGSPSSPLAGVSGFVRGSPFMDVPSGAYMMPMAMASSSYEPTANQEMVSGGRDDYQSGSGVPVREIYIGHRPTRASAYPHYGAYSIPRLVQQSSMTNFRGIASSNRPYEQNEYMSRYPMAASYNYHQGYQAKVQPEEEQTISYGLSFGRGRHSSLVPSLSKVSAQVTNQEQADEPSSVANPNEMYRGFQEQFQNSLRNYQAMHPTSSVGQANYNYPQSSHSPDMVAAAQLFHGSHLLKSPADPMAGEPNVHSQISESGKPAVAETDEQRWMTRQHLLATLDTQLKSNPHYRPKQSGLSHSQPQALSQQLSASRFDMRAPDEAKAFEPEQTASDGDLSLYQSFHHEVDPNRMFTSASKLVSIEPLPENSIRTGSLKAPTNYDDHLMSKIEPTEDKPDTALHQRKPGTGDLSSLDSSNKAAIKHIGHEQKNSNPKQTEAIEIVMPTKDDDSDLGSMVSIKSNNTEQTLRRVRREDPEDREAEDAEDDGVWVDDDEDDDNRQTASDLNETSQQPEEEETDEPEAEPEPEPAIQQEMQQNVNPQRMLEPPVLISPPHGYELSHL